MSQARTRAIYIIRHGEKPPDPPVKAPPYGIDLCGSCQDHCLTPVGWQRAGALATLFAPYHSSMRDGLQTPTQLISPDYGDSRSTAEHRTYETIYPLSQWIKLAIENPYREGQEKDLAHMVSPPTADVTLICWEHTGIPTIAQNISPIAPGTKIPKHWPGTRFDVIFALTYDSDNSWYVFSQVPEMLLHGDVDAPIQP